MNYEKEYWDYYSRIYLIIQNRIKKYYLKQIEEKRTYGVTHEEIRNYFRDNIKDKIFLCTNKDLRLLRGNFNNGKTFYSEDIINLICEKRIVLEFASLDKSSYPVNYHFKKFLIQIALVNAINEVERLLQNNDQLFRLHYENKDFEGFEIVDYGDEIFRSSQYKSLLEKHSLDIYKEQYSSEIVDEEGNDEDNKTQKRLSPGQVSLLIEKIIIHCDKWANANISKRAEVIAKITGSSTDNVRKKIRMMEGKKSTHTEKFKEDEELTSEIIAKLLGR